LNPTKIIITGAKGRMGQTLVACAERRPELQVVGQIDLGDDLLPLIKEVDVVIDFSFHDATAQFATVCAEHRKALVIGTTGHSDAEKSQICGLKSHIPMVWASNYSTGVNTLFWLTRKAAEILGPNFDLEVVEMHHRMKKDAPSGTALRIAEEVAAALGRKPSDLRLSREGQIGERPRPEIGVQTLRGGDVVGEHTIFFLGEGERVELTHRATSREQFARGALRAARWVVSRSPGLYDMQDVLGLK